MIAKGVIKTVPIDLALSAAMGSSFVLASRATIPTESFLRSTSLWALIFFELVVFTPVGAYLLWRYPEWSYMYLLEAGSLGFTDWFLAGSYLVAGLVGWGIARVLVRRGHDWIALGFCVACYILAGAVITFGFRQLLSVGTTATFRSEGTMTALYDSPLAWVLAAAVIGVGAAWGVSVWRLILYGRAWQLEELQEAFVTGGEFEEVEESEI